MSRFQVSSHSCRVETGRFSGTAWCDRKCDKCLVNREQDEQHVLMECPATWLEYWLQYLNVVLNCDWYMKHMLVLHGT